MGGYTKKAGVTPTGVTLKPTPITKNQVDCLRVLASGVLAFSIIRSRLDRSSGNVSKTLKQLIKRKLVAQQDETKHYFLTPLGKKWILDNIDSEGYTRVTPGVTPNASKGSSGYSQIYKGVTPKPAKTRGHNIRVKWRIKHAPKGWRESPKKFFEHQHVDTTPLNLKNVDGVQFTMQDCTVKATSKHIVVILNAFYYSDVVEFLPIMAKQAFDMKRMLEREFRTLILDPMPVLTVGEIANEDDILANLRKAHGYQIIRHTDGRVRIAFDFSPGNGIIELEFLHRGMQDEDQETFNRRLVQFIDSPYEYDQTVLMAEQAKYKVDEQENTFTDMTEHAKSINTTLDGIVESLGRQKDVSEHDQRLLSRHISEHHNEMKEIREILLAQAKLNKVNTELILEQAVKKTPSDDDRPNYMG